jgi:hypothetical protein
MDYKQEAALWLSSAYFDEKTKAELWHSELRACAV